MIWAVILNVFDLFHELCFCSSFLFCTCLCSSFKLIVAYDITFLYTYQSGWSAQAPLLVVDVSSRIRRSICTFVVSNDLWLQVITRKCLQSDFGTVLFKSPCCSPESYPGNVKDANVHPRKACEAMAVMLHAFLISVLIGNEWIDAHPYAYPKGSHVQGAVRQLKKFMFIRLYLPTYSMAQCPSWEASWFCS